MPPCSHLIMVLRYTPLESVAFGVPTVTTSLSGFGQWILADFDNSFLSCGVRVEPRGDSNYDEVKEAIAADISSLVNAPATEIADIRKKAMYTADKASWRYFIQYYDEAYSLALRNAAARCASK